MQEITELCTGCRACEQLCPTHSIAMRPDHEGFLNAVIDQASCIDCGLCVRRCPQNEPSILKFKDSIKTYGARVADKDVLARSASGGAFAGMAIKALRQGWWVFGVAFDNNYIARHTGINALEDLPPLLSSKYVQSNTEDTFSQVRDLLKQGEKVLYSGTGCQIGGLLSFLGKDYANLLTVDLICHGVTSPLLWSKYIEYLKQFHDTKNLSGFNFRDKTSGWGLRLSYNKDGKTVYRRSESDKYYTHFLSAQAYRYCCYSCKYAKPQRCSDITIGDFWGIEKEHPNFKAQNGASAILINSEKGLDFWHSGSSDFHYVESSFDKIAKNNGNLLAPSTLQDAAQRKLVYEGIESLTPEEYINSRLAIKSSIVARIKEYMPPFVFMLAKKLKAKIHS